MASTTERGLGWSYERLAGPIRRAAVGRQCPRCGVVMVADRRSRFAATVDHIVPRAEGGLNTPGNLRAVCRRCNCSLGARLGQLRRRRARAVRRLGTPSRVW